MVGIYGCITQLFDTHKKSPSNDNVKVSFDGF